MSIRLPFHAIMPELRESGARFISPSNSRCFAVRPDSLSKSLANARQWLFDSEAEVDDYITETKKRLFYDCLLNERGCWEWQRSTGGDYGILRFNGKLQMAHRVAYELCVGPIPDGMKVLHDCDNPLCVNPDHLKLGTLQDNLKERDRKGRQAHGETHGRAILSEADVIEIRRLYSRGHNSLTELGDIYGVHSTQIKHVVSRRNWKHVP